MKDKICATLTKDHIYICNGGVIGRSGENECTQLEITLDECLCDRWVYIDFIKPDGSKYKTPKLDIVDNKVIYDIPNALLQERGYLKVQVVLQNEKGEIWKSNIKTYGVNPSINATDDIPNQDDFITEAQRLLNEVEEGLTPTIGDNGNWFVLDKDTGKPSRGIQGEKGEKGDPGDTTNKVDKKTRNEVTDVYSYNHEKNSVPYLYGVYGDKNNGYVETQGLIKGSTGIVRSEIAKEYEETNPEIAEEIRNGDMTNARQHLDIHTIAIRDGNCSIPVGMLNDELDEEGNPIRILYYGSAIPRPYFQKYVDIHVGDAIKKLNIKNGTTYGLYQDSEKDDTAVPLKFSAFPEDIRVNVAGTYNRGETGRTAVAFGSSVATGKRSMAAGSSNLASGDSAMALGTDCFVGSNQGFSSGYANAVVQGATAGSCFGSNNIVKAENGHAHGINNIVTINEATAQGVGLIANNWAQTVVGKYNNSNVEDTLFVVGNGDSESNRKNAFTVNRDGSMTLGNTKITEQNFNDLFNSIDGLEDLLGGI